MAQEPQVRATWDWAKIGKIFGGLVLVAGLFKTYVVVEDIQKRQQVEAERQEEKAILDWQQPVVRQLIAKHGRDGVAYSELREEYREEAREHHLPRNKLGSLELQRIILSLTEKHAVITVGAEKVRILSESDLCGAQNTVSDVQNHLGSKALESVSKVNGQLSAEQVLAMFEKEFGINSGDAQSLFGGLLNFRYIGVHPKTGRVWNLIKRQDMAKEVNATPVMVIQPVPDPRFNQRRVETATYEDNPRQPYRRQSRAEPSEAYPSVLPEN